MNLSGHRNPLRLLLLVGAFLLTVSTSSHAKENKTAVPRCDQADLTADRANANANACRDNTTTVEKKNQNLLSELLQADSAQQTEQTAKEKTTIIITDTSPPTR